MMRRMMSEVCRGTSVLHADITAPTDTQARVTASTNQQTSTRQRVERHGGTSVGGRDWPAVSHALSRLPFIGWLKLWLSDVNRKRQMLISFLHIFVSVCIYVFPWKPLHKSELMHFWTPGFQVCLKYLVPLYFWNNKPCLLPDTEPQLLAANVYLEHLTTRNYISIIHDMFLLASPAIRFYSLLFWNRTYSLRFL